MASYRAALEDPADEHTPLSQQGKSVGEIKLSPSMSRISFVMASIVVSGVLALAVVKSSSLLYPYEDSSHGGYVITKSSAYDYDSDLEFTVVNEYGNVVDSMLPYPFLQDALFAEPYKDSTVTVTNSMDGCVYDWIVRGPYTEESTWSKSWPKLDSGSSEDSTIELNLKTVGQYKLYVTESECDDSSYNRTAEKTLWVKYVRRELNSLTDDDREAFLDAFHTLWEVSTVDGMELYGEKYKSVYYFAVVHNDAGGNSNCDEFHGGLGFVNNHMMLSAYLEQSLQLVDPTTALHYLDYTKYFDSDFDSHLSNQLDGGSWTNILTDEFFGSSDPITGEILDGRWAGLEIPFVTTDFLLQHGVNPNQTFFPYEEELWLQRTNPHINSPYGLLRAPWNYNPSSTLSRYNNVHQIPDLTDINSGVYEYYAGVTCDAYTVFMESIQKQPMVTYLHDAEDDIHGIIHFTFGGAGGSYAYSQNQILKNDYGFTDEYLIVLAQSAQTFYKGVIPVKPKEFYEEEYGIEFPLSCTPDPWQNGTLTTTAEPGEEGGSSCQCTDSYFEDEDSLDVLVNQFFLVFSKDVNKPQYQLVKYVLGLDFDTKTEVMKIICGRMAFDGDMAGSGAAQDPLFWVAHGAVERLMQRVVFEGVLTDTVYTEDPNDLEHCSGHMENQTKAWLSGFEFLDTSLVAEELTNIDISAILDPASDLYRDNVNFVYDVSAFSWCSDESTWF